MRKSIIILILFPSLYFSQKIEFEDYFLEKFILMKNPEIDINKDNSIDKSEADKVTKLDLSWQKIRYLEDIYWFKNLTSLDIYQVPIENLELDKFKNIEEFYCGENGNFQLNVSNLPKLKKIVCQSNNLDKLQINNCPNIEILILSLNNLKNINLIPFPNLKELSLNNNQLQTLDITNNIHLQELNILENKIKKIDISKNINLKMNRLYIDENVSIVGTKEQIKNFKPAPLTTELKIK